MGVEIPERLGALFIGDADYLRGLAGGEPPLVDDFPQRILARGAQRSASVPRAFYRRMMDAREARRERTLDYFEWQHRIDEGFLTLALWQPPSIAGLAELDGVLSRTSLDTLALWSLGTSPAAAGRRSWRSPPRRELDRHHAATTLSGRGWTRASE